MVKYPFKYNRFWKIYFWKIGLKENPGLISKRGEKEKFYVRDRDWGVFNEYYFQDGYDDIETSAFDTVVDVGANIGLFSISISRDIEVFSYEPNPKTYAVLRKNVNLNSRENIVPKPVGLGAENSEKQLFLGEGSATDSTLVAGEGDVEKVEIHVRNINDELQNLDIGKKAMLKLDCEGCEFPIIEEATEENLQSFDLIFFEYHSDAGNPREISEKLKSSGFKVEERRDPRKSVDEDVGFLKARRQK